MDVPPGFRFFPTEEELVSFYLHNKLEGSREDLNRVMDQIIPVLDIYNFNPWELPQYSGERCKADPEQWFFFIPRQEREARGGRPQRLTTTGYWKTTGSPSFVYSNASNRGIGMKRIMVFYLGRAPNGKKTEWKMNEYKAIQGDHYASSSSACSSPELRHEFSLCRVYKHSKCLRAFDRRPLGVEIGLKMRSAGVPAASAAAAAAHGDEAMASYHHQNPPLTVEKISSFAQSSSSGDHGTNPSQAGETTNMPMSFDAESWDWESVWYFSGDHQDVRELMWDVNLE